MYGIKSLQSISYMIAMTAGLTLLTDNTKAYAATGQSFANSSIRHADPMSLEKREGPLVTDVFRPGQGRPSQVLLQRPSFPVLQGSILTVYRDTKDWTDHSRSADVQTGQVKVVSIQPGYVLAEVIAEGSRASQHFYPNFPGIMAGDFLKPQEVRVQKKQQLIPTSTLSYFDLFVDPNPYPSTFELSERGKLILMRVAGQYASLRLPLLLIEGHTDQEGPQDVNQIESYQRALTVRQFLIERLSFDKERLVALGLGETQPVAEPYLPGHRRKARRIVIKAKSSPMQQAALRPRVLGLGDAN